jgi:hypothetical protein
MNKTLVCVIVGIVLGATGMWLVNARHAAAEPAKPEPAAAEKPKENPLHLPPAKRDAAGVKLAQPEVASIAPEVMAYGRVLDPTTLIVGTTEVATARAALTASQKEADRARKLFAAGGNASAQAVETAEANLGRDRAALAAAQAKLAANWGGAIVDHLDELAAAVQHGSALARLDLLPGDHPAANPARAQITLPGGGEAFAADVLGAAAVADSQVQGPSFLVLLRDHPLAAGTAVRATLPGEGAAAKAVVVPRSAIVYHQGSAWAFVLGEEDTFERKLVTVDRAVGQGVAVTSGLEPSEQVVIAGAQQLLSAELQAGGAPVDE